MVEFVAGVAVGMFLGVAGLLLFLDERGKPRGQGIAPPAPGTDGNGMDGTDVQNEVAAARERADFPPLKPDTPSDGWVFSQILPPQGGTGVVRPPRFKLHTHDVVTWKQGEQIGVRICIDDRLTIEFIAAGITGIKVISVRSVHSMEWQPKNAADVKEQAMALRSFLDCWLLCALNCIPLDEVSGAYKSINSNSTTK